MDSHGLHDLIGSRDVYPIHGYLATPVRHVAYHDTLLASRHQQHGPGNPCPRACNLTRITYSRSDTRTFCSISFDTRRPRPGVAPSSRCHAVRPGGRPARPSPQAGSSCWIPRGRQRMSELSMAWVFTTVGGWGACVLDATRSYSVSLLPWR
jgi:hypothetical protein